MNDAFASKIYPSILYVLELLDRIYGRKPGEVDPHDELPRLKQYLGQLDSRGADERDFQLAKAALVYWIDEVLVNSPWPHAGEWKDQTLERELYDSRDRAWEFFEKSKAARTLGRSDALEVYYLCVALGFLGIYRDGEYRGTGTDSGPMRAMPAPEPASKPKSPGPGGAGKGGRGPEMISWFGEAEVQNPESQTWGLGGLPTSPPAPAPAPTPAPQPAASSARRDARGPAGPGRGPSGSVRDLPRTLEEWAAPVYAQIAPGAIRGFTPSVAGESQRDARPLQGLRNLKRTIGMTAWMGVLAIVLAVVRMWWLS